MPAWSSKRVLATTGSFACKGGAGTCLFRGWRGRRMTSARSGSRRTNTVTWLCVNRSFAGGVLLPRYHGSAVPVPSFSRPQTTVVKQWECFSSCLSSFIFFQYFLFSIYSYIFYILVLYEKYILFYSSKVLL